MLGVCFDHPWHVPEMHKDLAAGFSLSKNGSEADINQISTKRNKKLSSYTRFITLMTVTDTKRLPLRGHKLRLIWYDSLDINIQSVNEFDPGLERSYLFGFYSR